MSERRDPRPWSSQTPPRDGPSVCIWRRCRCKNNAITCRPSDSTATIVSSSTTCVRRCSGVCLASDNASSHERPSSITSTGHSATPFSAGRDRLARWSPSNGRTSSVPLDRQREWYRYNNLFRDVLRTELARRERGDPGAAREGGDRFEEPGRLEDALVHAHASGDEDRAAELLQRVGLASIGSGGLPPSVGGSTCSVRTSSPGTGARPDGGVDRGLGGIPSRPIAGPRRPIGSHSPARPCSGRRRSDRPRPWCTRPCLAAAPMPCTERRSSRSGRSRRAVSSAPPRSRTSVSRPDPWGRPAADVLFAEASEVGLRIGGMTAASLALAERSLIATSQGDRAAADEYAQHARAVVHDAHLHEHITTGPVHAASALVALRAGDQEQARVELSAAQRLRPILTWGFPTISVQTRSSSLASTWGSPTRPAPERPWRRSMRS